MFFFTQLHTPPFLFFQVSSFTDLFPSGFIHDLHLEIIELHENTPSAIFFENTSACMCVHMCREGDIRASSAGFRLY